MNEVRLTELWLHFCAHIWCYLCLKTVFVDKSSPDFSSLNHFFSFKDCAPLFLNGNCYFQYPIEFSWAVSLIRSWGQSVSFMSGSNFDTKIQACDQQHASLMVLRQSKGKKKTVWTHCPISDQDKMMFLGCLQVRSCASYSSFNASPKFTVWSDLVTGMLRNLQLTAVSVSSSDVWLDDSPILHFQKKKRVYKIKSWYSYLLCVE